MGLRTKNTYGFRGEAGAHDLTLRQEVTEHPLKNNLVQPDRRVARVYEWERQQSCPTNTDVLDLP